MDAQQLFGAATMLVLGGGLSLLGRLGRRGRLEYSLGGWTKDTTTPTSWVDAHRTIGGWLIVAGVVALLVAPGGVGPVVVGGSVLLLVPVIIGVVAGTGRLRAD